MKWQLLFMVFWRVLYAYPWLGRWVPENMKNVVIHVKHEYVVGTIDDNQSVQMKIRDVGKNMMILDTIEIQRKPRDWMNVVKYRNHIEIFRKIKDHGIECEFHFIDENKMNVKPKIGDNTYEDFILWRDSGDREEKEKNDF